jgi:hypothetical protein
MRALFCIQAFLFYGEALITDAFIIAVYFYACSAAISQTIPKNKSWVSALIYDYSLV